MTTLSIPANDSRYAFSGHEAETVVRSERLYRSEAGAVSRVAITRYLRNRHGEYFYWQWSTDDDKFLKHISHASAKAVLKHRYAAPA